MTRTYPSIRKALSGTLFFMYEPKMQEILAMLEIRLAGGAPLPEVLASIRATNQAAATRARRSAGSGGAIGVLPIYGIVTHRQMADISGGSSGTSTNALSAALRQMVDDPAVSSIVLDIDSPGGDVDGVDELASEIYAARKQKKITAVSNCLCASAAYYLASQASEIVVSPSSVTGSIGVYTMHEDDSAMLEAAGIKLELIKFGENKAESNNLGPLSDSARAHIQLMVDIYGNAFEKAVARGRGITQADVHKKFGQGRVFDAKTAVRIGMADRVGTLTDVLSTSAPGRQTQFAAMRHHLDMAGVMTNTPGMGSYVITNGNIGGGGGMSETGRRELGRMRHELNMAKYGATAKPKRSKRAGADDSDCSCDCVPCDGGDCDDCSHDGCACEGCECESATAAKARALEFEKMRHEIAVAAAQA